MAKYIYPAVFTKEGTQYSVYFPDLESCYTQGDSLQDAYEMAGDVLCLTLYNLEEEQRDIPTASEVSALQTDKDKFSGCLRHVRVPEILRQPCSKKDPNNPCVVEHHGRTSWTQFFCCSPGGFEE